MEKVSLSGSASSFVRGEPIKIKDQLRKVPRKEIKKKKKKKKKKRKKEEEDHKKGKSIKEYMYHHAFLKSMVF